jgi:hypothetical protein
MSPQIRSDSQAEGFTSAGAREVQSVLDVLTVPMSFDLICDRTNLSQYRVLQILKHLVSTNQVELEAGLYI